jgi:hypothetical protein
MNEETLENWEGFEDALKRLREVRDGLKSKGATHVSNLLYRGQSDSRWLLQTTLQRYTNTEKYRLLDYYRKISVTKPQIETTTGKSWEMPSYPEFSKWLENVDIFMPESLPAYDYLIYLRHHGFPSPLLDWTQSPYIAAFFAFSNLRADAKFASIYAFLEYTGAGKSYSSDRPYIKSLGPYIRSHERHFVQKCQYTLCLEGYALNTCYSSHQDAFATSGEDQDVLWKFNIPSEERLKVLKYLETVNINSYSLFRSAEGLMDTMAFRTFYLRE